MSYSNKIAFAFVVIVFLVSGIFVFINTDSIDKEDIKSKSTKREILLDKYKKEAEKIKVSEKVNPKLAKEKTNILISQLPEKYKKYFSIGFNAADNVEFNGRVIDQHNQPVKYAKVNYEIAGKYLSRGSGLGSILTDQNGNFRITGFGAIMRINQISHPSIDFHHKPTQAFGLNSHHQARAIGVVFYNYPTKPESGLLSHLSAKQETPHIFKAWRIDNKTTNKNMKKGRIFDGMVADGRIYTLNFDSKNRRKMQEGVHKGHIKASCKRKQLKSKMERDDKNDWEFTLEAIGGGLQETSDYYLNSAPQSGYKKAIRLSQKKNSVGYQHYIKNKRYYFTANNSSVYGAIFFHIEPFAKKNYCYLSMDLFKFNSTGSRNLLIK